MTPDPSHPASQQASIQSDIQPDITHPTRFASTRAAHADETAEDYVEAIAQLIDQSGTARVGELARCMGVSHVTVTRILARLERDGLVTRQPRKPIKLTVAGRAMATQSLAKHETVLAFLLALGINEQQAQIDAEGIEHHVSEQTLSALAKLTEKLNSSP